MQFAIWMKICTSKSSKDHQNSTDPKRYFEVFEKLTSACFSVQIARKIILLSVNDVYVVFRDINVHAGMQFKILSAI